MFKAANPYDEIVTKATADTLTAENWEINLEVCDKVSGDGEAGARNCISAIQKRLVHRAANVQLYALTLSDALAKNCGIQAHRELASRTFTQSLARLVADRNTHDSVRKRVVALLKEWAKDFNDEDGSLGLVKETVEQLRQQGFKFEEDGHTDAPVEPSSEQLRREDEELRRVLELSVQDQGGRGAYASQQQQSYSSAPSSSSATAAGVASRPGGAAAALVDKSLPDPNATAHAPTNTQQYQNQQQQQAASQPPAPAQANKAPSRVRALYDFAPSEVGELPFSKGDIIRVLDSVYEHWWRGELRGEAGIFPVNYVEILPDPTPDEIRREAEQEARIFQQAGDIDRLLAKLRTLEAEAQQGGHAAANLADDEELQDLYQSSLAMRPRIVRLIDRYSSKVQELRSLNEKFVQARGAFDGMMERSMAVHQPGQSTGQYLGVRPEYGYAQSQQQQQQHAPVQQQPYQPQQQQQQPPPSHDQQAHQYQQSQPGQYQATEPNGYAGAAAPPMQQGGSGQWYGQQPQQQQYHPPQPQQQHQPYPQQHQQQHQQQNYAGGPFPTQNSAAPGGNAGGGGNPQEDEKRRLYEQARREAEAYHAAYGQYPHGYQAGSGAPAGGSGAGSASAPTPAQ